MMNQNAALSSWTMVCCVLGMEPMTRVKITGMSRTGEILLQTSFARGLDLINISNIVS